MIRDLVRVTVSVHTDKSNPSERLDNPRRSPLAWLSSNTNSSEIYSCSNTSLFSAKIILFEKRVFHTVKAKERATGTQPSHIETNDFPVIIYDRCSYHSTVWNSGTPRTKVATKSSLTRTDFFCSSYSDFSQSVLIPLVRLRQTTNASDCNCSHDTTQN
jgi:hypothetical protein